MRQSWETAPPPEFRENALQGLIGYALEVYKENARIASLIEDKAQKTAAISGVFVGVFIGFTRTGTSNTPQITPDTLKVYVFAILCLIMSVVFSVVAMRVTSRVTMLPFDALVELLGDKLAESSSEIALEDRVNLRWDQINTWKAVIREQQTSNRDKALLVRVAQALLMLAIVGSAISTMMVLARSL